MDRRATRRAEGQRLAVGPGLAEAARRRLESILDDNGEVTPGVIFTCQALAPAADFYSSAGSAQVGGQVIAVQQDTVIMCCLNRPTSEWR